MRRKSGKWKAVLRKIASGIIFWSGLVVIVLIAIPTVIPVGLIILIWKGTDFLVKKIDGDDF